MNKVILFAFVFIFYNCYGQSNSKIKSITTIDTIFNFKPFSKQLIDISVNKTSVYFDKNGLEIKNTFFKNRKEYIRNEFFYEDTLLVKSIYNTYKRENDLLVIDNQLELKFIYNNRKLLRRKYLINKNNKSSYIRELRFYNNKNQLVKKIELNNHVLEESILECVGDGSMFNDNIFEYEYDVHGNVIEETTLSIEKGYKHEKYIGVYLNPEKLNFVSKRIKKFDKNNNAIYLKDSLSGNCWFVKDYFDSNNLIIRSEYYQEDLKDSEKLYYYYDNYKTIEFVEFENGKTSNPVVIEKEIFNTNGSRVVNNYSVLGDLLSNIEYDKFNNCTKSTYFLTLEKFSGEIINDSDIEEYFYDQHNNLVEKRTYKGDNLQSHKYILIDYY